MNSLGPTWELVIPALKRTPSTTTGLDLFEKDGRRDFLTQLKHSAGNVHQCRLLTIIGQMADEEKRKQRRVVSLCAPCKALANEQTKSRSTESRGLG
jgi:predicted metal-dependent hydrolase